MNADQLGGLVVFLLLLMLLLLGYLRIYGTNRLFQEVSPQEIFFRLLRTNGISAAFTYAELKKMNPDMDRIFGMAMQRLQKGLGFWGDVWCVSRPREWCKKIRKQPDPDLLRIRAESFFKKGDVRCAEQCLEWAREIEKGTEVEEQ